MIRILFVCHGNICRSPMAEFVMKDIVDERGLDGGARIESAATSSEEIGNPVHRGTKRILAAQGIDCAGKRARRMNADDYGRYDYLIGMDEENVHRMKAICGGDPDGKISKLLDFAGIHRSIADPWYTGDFDTTYRDVMLGCEALYEYLLDQAL